MNDGRASVVVGVGRELDAGEVGRLLAEGDAEEEIGPDGNRRDRKWPGRRCGADDPRFTTVGDVAGDLIGMRWAAGQRRLDDGRQPEVFSAHAHRCAGAKAGE